MFIFQILFQVITGYLVGLPVQQMFQTGDVPWRAPHLQGIMGRMSATSSRELVDLNTVVFHQKNVPEKNLEIASVYDCEVFRFVLSHLFHGSDGTVDQP